MLRGGLIGCGDVTKTHLSQWKRVEGAQIVAACDLNMERARERAAEHGIPDVYRDHRELLAKADVDFVDVATPTDSHLPIVRDAASAGCHVLCQKPIAQTLEDLDAMDAACRQAGVRFMVNENYRFQPWFRRMKELMNDGAIGDPFYARFHIHGRHSLPEFYFGEQTELFSRMERLILFEVGVHYLDTMRYLLGEPRALFATANKVSPHAKGEDSAVVLVQYPHASALIDSSWASLSDDTPTEPVSDQTYVVEGSAGTLHLDHNATLHLLSDTGRSSEQFGADGPQLGFGNAFEHFVEGVTTNSPFETDGAATRKTMELVFGAYQSAATGNAYHPGDPLERFNGKGERA